MFSESNLLSSINCVLEIKHIWKSGPRWGFAHSCSYAFDARSLLNPLHYSTNIIMLVHSISQSNNKQFRQLLAPMRGCRQATNKYDHPLFSHEEFRTWFTSIWYENLYFRDDVVFVYDFYILLCILSTIPWLIKTLNAIWIPEKYLISSTLSAIGKRRGKAYTWVHDTQACRFHEKEQGRMTLGKCGFQKVLWGQGPQSWERRQITKCRAVRKEGDAVLTAYRASGQWREHREKVLNRRQRTSMWATSGRENRDWTVYLSQPPPMSAEDRVRQ
jgi:hypothetical protein